MVKTLIMPEELGGREYKIRERPPSKLNEKIFEIHRPFTVYKKDKNGKYMKDKKGNFIFDEDETQVNISAEALNESVRCNIEYMVVEPTNLNLSEMDALEKDFLAEACAEMITKHTLNEEQRKELKKKVAWR